MKKLILFMLIYFLYFYQVDANWYGTTDGTNKAIPISYDSVGSATTECPDDGDTTGGYAPSYNKDHAVTNSVTNLNPNPVLNTYLLNSNLTNAIPKPPFGTMYCLKWDGQNPVNPTSLTLSNVKNSDGSSCNYVGGVYYCKKSGVSMNFNWGGASDAGGSGLNGNGYQYVFQRASDQAWLVSGFSPSGIYVSASSLQEGTYYTWVRSFDNAGNFITDGFGNAVYKKGPDIVIDTTRPTASDIGDTNPRNLSHLLAVNSKTFSLYVDSGGGSPIVDIDGKFENYATPTSYDLFSSNSSSLTFATNIQNVDLNRELNGLRTYNFHLTNVCDAAGNCLSGANIKDYNYYVYANTTNIATRSVTQNQIDDTTNVADGTLKYLKITLKDGYQNAIVPVPAIGRTIDVNFNSVTNSMYLDQYNRTGAKSVYISKANQSTYSNTLLPGGNTSINGETPTSNGDYIYGFKFYTPTASSTQNAVSDPNAIFSIGNITFDVNGTYGVSAQSVSSSNINANYKPLYQTNITGDYTTDGFIEGNVQYGNLARTTTSGGNESGVSSVSKKLYLKFGGSATTNYGLKVTGGNLNLSTVGESATLSTDYGFTSDNLNTLLQLTVAPAPNVLDAYMSSHIAYTIDGLNVLYNSDIVGKTSYFGAQSGAQANQSGLKIVGTTYSSAGIESVVSGQSTQTLGELDKSILKTSIIKNSYDFAENVDYSTITNGTQITNIDSNTSGGGKRVGNVIYMGDETSLPNQTYELGNGSDLSVNSTKTILVIGGNLYIRSNISYAAGSNDTLGIVVLKDRNGNGGNIYIDQGVKHIVGSMFAEKSLISYNGTELDGNTQASTLKNQLYIYGNVFSYNTIGGSAKNPPQCPYYVPLSNCSTKQIAQKYDLNYLRRYYLKDTNSDGVGDTPAYASSNYFASGTPNYSYPIIIEYNSNVQSNPPPFFSN